MSVTFSRVSVAPQASIPLAMILVAMPLLGAVAPLASAGSVPPAVHHLVISEVVTGGPSASDELIELYNPGSVALPLEGLELVYASAAGTTVSRRALWGTDAPLMPPGTHLLVAHESGVYAPIADVVYAGGLAATGGSVALRIEGAAEAIDAVGWGTATNAWVEGSPAVAPAPGASIERLPGGAAGSTQDTDDNASDFVERALPDPQNAASPPVPVASPHPSASPVASASPAPSSSPAPTPSAPAVLSVAVARGLPDGTVVTIEGTALTGSGFHDGGGYVADASAGLAVLLDAGSFARGSILRVTGTIGDRFSQRTLRSGAGGVEVIGSGPDPLALSRATATIGESAEAMLLRVAGLVHGAPTALSAGLAFDVDDGSGPARVVVATATGIDTTGWVSGARIELVGVVGQRDSSGSGAAGYRLQPRDEADVIALQPPATPSPSPSAAATPGPTPTTGASPVTSVADARRAPKDTRLTVRGVITMPTGVIDPVSAVIQDATGAILLRTGGEVGALGRGELVEVDGTRSTLAGMETVRVTTAPRRAGTASEPSPRQLRTGDASEDDEAMLVIISGAVSAPRRAATGTISFDLDDGSGPLRVVIDGSLGVDGGPFVAGTWVEARGVLGQETTGAQPLRGYRLWPRGAADLRVIAVIDPADAVTGASPAGRAPVATPRPAAGGAASLAGIMSADLRDLRVAATLVAAEWPELGIGGLLWDGERLVAIAASSADAVSGAIGSRRPPLVLEVSGLRLVGPEHAAELPVVTASVERVSRGAGPVAGPVGAMPDPGAPPQWVSLVGRIADEETGPALRHGSALVTLDFRCEGTSPRRSGVVGVTGIGLASPARIIVPCDGLRAAPALHLPGGASPLTPPPAPAITAAVSETPTGSDMASRGLAAALLGLSVIGLVGAAVVRRWLDEDDPGGAELGAAEQESSSGDRSEPALRLVSLPRERGSP